MFSKWQFWVLVALLILVGLAVFGYKQAVPSANRASGHQPRIIVEPVSFDFGEIEFGRVAETSFKIKNAGAAALEIRRVATSCSCTTAKVSKTRLEPGEEADLNVRYDTAAMGSGSHGMGLQERIIYVKTNDPVTPQMEVTTVAVVK